METARLFGADGAIRDRDACGTEEQPSDYAIARRFARSLHPGYQTNYVPDFGQIGCAIADSGG
jgi:hypothetical protein